MTTEKKSSPLEHLADLRRSLIRSLLALAGGMLVALVFAREIFHTLQIPLLKILPANSSFIATSPIEAFVVYLKVALLAGLFLASPIIFYEAWRFIAPGLYANEKKWSLTFVLASVICFVGGALFGYFVVFPIGFKFFVGALAGTDIRFLPQMGSYLGFASKLLLVFGVLFEFPLVLVILGLLGIVTHKQLSRARRYVIVLVFIVAAVLTPSPDILTQILLAIPLLILYELSLFIVWLLEKRRPGEQGPTSLTS